MAPRHDRSSPALGSSTGDAGPTKPARSEESRITLRRFSATAFEEQEVTDVGSLPSPQPDQCLWVDVTGLGDPKTVEGVGRAYALHELSLEDALDPSQRGKIDYYDGYTFIVLRTLRLAPQLEQHRLSIAFGDGFVVTLQHDSDTALSSVRDRLRSGRGKLRGRGADYLAYALVDSAIDHYFPVVDAFDDHLEYVEDAMLEQDAGPVELARNAKRDLRIIRHTVWSTREIVNSLLREDTPGISDETRVHLRDCHDHIVQLQEMVESSREIAASLLEAYLTRMTLRTNEVMKVLTVIATIFIPLTFITGLYGMNFDPHTSPWNMPELDWYYGYPVSLLIMLLITMGTIRYFWRKGWLGRSQASDVTRGALGRRSGKR